MKEIVLKDYFDFTISAKALNKDVNGSQVKTGFDTTRLNIDIIEDEDEYEITTKHLIKLVEDAMLHEISFQNLATIAFALEGSDFFMWDNETIDGEKVARALFEWDNEIINYPINKENLELWNIYLKTGNYNLKR